MTTNGRWADHTFPAHCGRIVDRYGAPVRDVSAQPFPHIPPTDDPLLVRVRRRVATKASISQIRIGPDERSRNRAGGSMHSRSRWIAEFLLSVALTQEFG
jgi:hypothetical protein